MKTSQPPYGGDMSSLQLFAVVGSIFILGTVFYLLEDVLIPFVAAWVLAYLLVPVVDLLDSYRYVPRWLAILISFLLLIAVLSVLYFGLVPIMHAQLSTFLAQLPSYEQQVSHVLGSLSSHFHLKVDLTVLSHGIANRLIQLGTPLLKAPFKLMSTAANVVKTVIFIGLVPIVAFLLLRDWHWLVQGLESFVRASRRSSVELFVRTADQVLRHYIHGQLLVMLSVGIMYTIGYAITGIALWLVLGLLAGVAFVVPFAAFVLSGIPAIFIAIAQYHDIVHPLMILLTIGVSELVGNLVMTPVLVGRFVRVHPAAVLLFIFAGGALFGVFGMIMALPLAAMATAWIGRLRSEPAYISHQSPAPP